MAEHSDQSVQGVQVGHGLVLHETVSFRSPPPHAKGSSPVLVIVHSLIRDLRPPSQLAEHSVHSVHSVHFGHLLGLQFLDSSKGSLQGLSSKIK